MSAGRARLLVGVAVCASLFCLAESQARAQSFKVTLDYAVATGCPTVEEFKNVVAGRLGYDPFADGMPERVLVRITPRGGLRGSIDGRLEWRDSAGGWAGEQTFPSVTTDCTRFVRVVGFALAVQIQLLAAVRAAPPVVAPPTGAAASSGAANDHATPPIVRDKPPDPESVAVAASVPQSPRPTPLPPPPASSRPVLSVGVGPAVAVGMSSSPIVLGRVLGALAWTRVSIELAAEFSFPSVTRRMDGAGFSQQHVLVAAAGCAAATPWNACIVLKGGQVRMSGRDIDRPTSASAPLFDAGVRVGASHRLSERVFLNAHVDALTALSRWTVTLDKVPVWTAPRFAAAVGVDALVRFP